MGEREEAETAVLGESEGDGAGGAAMSGHAAELPQRTRVPAIIARRP